MRSHVHRGGLAWVALMALVALGPSMDGLAQTPDVTSLDLDVHAEPVDDDASATDAPAEPVVLAFPSKRAVRSYVRGRNMLASGLALELAAVAAFPIGFVGRSCGDYDVSSVSELEFRETSVATVFGSAFLASGLVMTFRGVHRIQALTRDQRAEVGLTRRQRRRARLLGWVSLIGAGGLGAGLGALEVVSRCSS